MRIDTRIKFKGQHTHARYPLPGTYALPLTRSTESLGGNARTCVVTCISPSQKQEDESISTLRFGVRAKKVAPPCPVLFPSFFKPLILSLFLFSKPQNLQVTNCAKVNTQRSFADIAAALAAAEAELQQLRSSAASSGDADEVSSLRAAAATESQRRSLLEGELQALRERAAAAAPSAGWSQDESAKCRADLAKCAMFSPPLSRAFSRVRHRQ